MILAERRIVNAPDVEVMPGVFVPLHVGLAYVAALRKDIKNLKKSELGPLAHQLWID